MYGTATGQLLPSGGQTRGGHNDTWVWKGTTWRRLPPATAPAPRHHADTAYDTATGDVIVSGDDGHYPGNTWSWNATTGTQLSPATSPGVITTAGQASHDTATGPLLLPGGDPGNGHPPADDTCARDGTTNGRETSDPGHHLDRDRQHREPRRPTSQHPKHHHPRPGHRNCSRCGRAAATLVAKPGP